VTFVPKTAYSIPADEIQNQIKSGKQFHYFNGIGLIRASMNPNLPNTFSFRGFTIGLFPLPQVPKLIQ